MANNFKHGFFRLGVVLCLTVFLPGCGGGGGSSSNSSGNSNGNLKFTASVSQLVIQSWEDSPGATQTVILNVGGRPKTGFYVAAAVEGDGIDPNLIIETTDDKAYYRVTAASGLKAGSYAGKLSLLACTDESCTRLIGNTPIVIPYTVNILPIFKVSTSEIDRQITFGQTVTEHISVQLPYGSNSFSVQPGTNWLSATNIQSDGFDLNFYDLPPGTYYGGVDVQVGDEKRSIQVNLKVVSASLPESQAALKKLDGVNDWSGYQGGQKHNAYVPINLDVSKFSKRWIWPSSGSIYANITAPVVSQNEIFISYQETGGFQSYIFSFSELDGSLGWYEYIGNADSVLRLSMPVIRNGAVYAVTQKVDYSRTLLGFDQVVKNKILNKDLSGGSMSFYEVPSFDFSESALFCFSGGNRLQSRTLDASVVNWTSDTFQGSDAVPTLANGVIYQITNGVVFKLNAETGEVIKSQTIQTNVPGGSDPVVPVIAPDGDVLSIGYKYSYSLNEPISLVRIDKDTLSVKWSVQGEYQAEPVVANDVVYVLNSNPLQLEARSYMTGDLLWAWRPDGLVENRFYGNLVASNNLVLLSTNKAVRAIDVTTHSSAWAYAGLSKSISISDNGILYLLHADWVNDFGDFTNLNLQAINLH